MTLSQRSSGMSLYGGSPFREPSCFANSRDIAVTTPAANGGLVLGQDWPHNGRCALCPIRSQ
eukprot:9299525-Lingulodinium_polyedra.AAC.1